MEVQCICSICSPGKVPKQSQRFYSGCKFNAFAAYAPRVRSLNEISVFIVDASSMHLQHMLQCLVCSNAGIGLFVTPECVSVCEGITDMCTGARFTCAHMTHALKHVCLHACTHKHMSKLTHTRTHMHTRTQAKHQVHAILLESYAEPQVTSEQQQQQQQVHSSSFCLCIVNLASGDLRTASNSSRCASGFFGLYVRT